MLRSGHTSPVPMAELMDINCDPDELAIAITEAYHRHVETYLATTRPPEDAEMAVSSGLLGSPLLGTVTRVAADWCHAWSLLGQWSGWVTFPVPASGIWPKHGHLRGILSGYQNRQPNFHKWARPAYEQGAFTDPEHSSWRSGHQGTAGRQNVPSHGDGTRLYEAGYLTWFRDPCKETTAQSPWLT